MTEYLNELRVAAAAQLLIATDESVLDICFRVGFGNYSNSVGSSNGSRALVRVSYGDSSRRTHRQKPAQRIIGNGLNPFVRENFLDLTIAARFPSIHQTGFPLIHRS